MTKSGRKPVYIAISFAVIIIFALSYVKFALPVASPPPPLKINLSKERIARGKYLAMHVSGCINCHSSLDRSRFTAPLRPNLEGFGGEKFDKETGFPGEIQVPNITPHALKSWSDGELYRAITSGIKKDGSAMFPLMPYRAYSKMATEDIYSIIAYIRTLPARKNSVQKRSLNIPYNFLVNTMSVKPAPQPIPPKNNQVTYGAYLTNAAACKECHTKQNQGNLLEGMDFSGGFGFGVPGGTVYSANITPDKQTGIGQWTEDLFVKKFQSYRSEAYRHPVLPGDFQTVMPWSMYSGMTENDLKAIFAYLKTVKPINNPIVKFTTEKL